MTAFEQRADSIYNQLLAIEASACDEQLFTCSYLLGHISLISANTGTNAEAFESQVRESLDQAYTVDQLSDQDKADIDALWQQLLGNGQ